MIQFTKYQAAGNAYIIINQNDLLLDASIITELCSSVYGAGGDGVICWKKLNHGVEAFIFNPDGTRAEKSGNGLRILASFLFEYHFQTEPTLQIRSFTEQVTAYLQPTGGILLEMGRVLPQHMSHDQLQPTHLDTPLGPINGYEVVTGNPHFVIWELGATAETAQKWGPIIENHPHFANRTNVQFARVEDEQTISAEIWERGAGYTLSSGSSSCAIAWVAHQMGWCRSKMRINMPGGTLSVEIRRDEMILLTGPVNKIVEGMFYQ